jgi:hypothetical protein
MRVRCLLTWFRFASPFFLVSWQLSPPDPRRFAAALRLRADFFFFPAGLWFALVLFAIRMLIFFNWFRCASPLIKVNILSFRLQQGSGGVCNPAIPPPSVGTAYSVLRFAHSGA